MRIDIIFDDYDEYSEFYSNIFSMKRQTFCFKIIYDLGTVLNAVFEYFSLDVKIQNYKKTFLYDKTLFSYYN
jgi:hypothetical protein